MYPFAALLDFLQLESFYFILNYPIIVSFHCFLSFLYSKFFHFGFYFINISINLNPFAAFALFFLWISFLLSILLIFFCAFVFFLFILYPLLVPYWSCILYSSFASFDLLSFSIFLSFFPLHLEFFIDFLYPFYQPIPILFHSLLNPFAILNPLICYPFSIFLFFLQLIDSNVFFVKFNLVVFSSLLLSDLFV